MVDYYQKGSIPSLSLISISMLSDPKVIDGSVLDKSKKKFSMFSNRSSSMILTAEEHPLKLFADMVIVALVKV